MSQTFDSKSLACGGCQGLGSHVRFCREVVGLPAAMRYSQSVKANNLADEVGSNNPAAANMLYQAAALLFNHAKSEADRYAAQQAKEES